MEGRVAADLSATEARRAIDGYGVVRGHGRDRMDDLGTVPLDLR